MRRMQTYARLTAAGDALAYEFSYHPDLITALKQQVPASARRWQAERRYWLIDPQYAPLIARLTEQYLGVTMTIPAMTAPRTEIHVIRLEYLGRCKERIGGERTAMGWADSSWSTIFPEAVLREWFSLPAEPDEAITLYGVLGIAQDTAVDAMRSAYRRLAKQWHPDICREPDAAEQFKAIQAAYSVLADPRLRRKYDAGLALERTLNTGRFHRAQHLLWCCPLRCGWVCAEGTVRLGKFIVSRILGWEDIINDEGQVLVTFWPTGAETFQSTWREQ